MGGITLHPRRLKRSAILASADCPERPRLGVFALEARQGSLFAAGDRTTLDRDDDRTTVVLARPWVVLVNDGAFANLPSAVRQPLFHRGPELEIEAGRVGEPRTTVVFTPARGVP